MCGETGISLLSSSRPNRALARCGGAGDPFPTTNLTWLLLVTTRVDGSHRANAGSAVPSAHRPGDERGSGSMAGDSATLARVRGHPQRQTVMTRAEPPPRSTRRLRLRWIHEPCFLRSGPQYGSPKRWLPTIRRFLVTTLTDKAQTTDLQTGDVKAT